MQSSATWRDSTPTEPWFFRLRRLLFRNVSAALIATAIDFLTYSALVAWAHVAPPIATALGCGVGAVVNFVINRVWTFQSHDSTLPQVWRYAMVSATGAALSSGGVATLMGATTWDYRLVWVVVRLAVSWGWNLPLQRFFVFGKSGAK